MPDTIEIKVDQIVVRSRIHDVLAANSELYFSCFYQRNPASLLNGLCEKYGSDKGSLKPQGHPYPWAPHTYADFVERLFDHCRQSVKNVFECGIGTNNPAVPSSMGVNGKPGASLRVWRDYFPEARVVGADIDRNIMFSEDRIETFYCDQTNPASIRELWAAVRVGEFDLMIDDGLHTVEAGVCLLENSFHKLREGGLYLIEDVNPYSIVSYRQFFARNTYRTDFVTLYRANGDLGDNSLIVIRK